ncbi:MAG: PIG-L deacetylase family protein [bacterium]|nr:PIG-L deacetylase family protein [bacterium]
MFNRILVLSPHTDDAELGAGGTIAKFVEEKKEVFYIAFSICEKSVPEGFDKDVCRQEVKEASKILGIKKGNLKIFDYEVRGFQARRQEILEDIVSIGKEILPDLVLFPSPNDTHQDHQTISQEAIRAFKTQAGLFGYEQPWNHMTFNTISFVQIQERHLQKKIEALKKYKSQAAKPYSKEEYIKGLAKVRGTQINVEYAEAFEVMRLIVK